MLCHFVDLVSEGLKTDKGLKEVHLRVVAKDLVELAEVNVTST